MNETSSSLAIVSLFLLLAAAPVHAVTCSDGNAVDGDCCSALGVQEESRFGFSGAPNDAGITSRAVACLNGGLSVCEDGIDNDGDGQADGNDPECSSLSALQTFAVVGTDPEARFSVRTGGNARVLRAGRAPITVSGFPVTESTCEASVCSCPFRTGPFGLPPSPPMIQSHPIPDCQSAGRACVSDADCAPFPYPRGLSAAAVCAVHAHLKRQSVYQGDVAMTGNVRFARGFLGPRSRLELGSRFLSNGGLERLDGEPPLVGPGLCSDLSVSCFSDLDCPLPQACEGRFQLDDGINDFIDRSGTHPAWLACDATIDTELGEVAAGLAALPPNMASPGAIALRALDPPLTLNFPSGTSVLTLPSLSIGKGAQLTLHGNVDSVVVLRVAGRVKMGGVGGIVTSGGLLAENVVWNIEGEKGPVAARRSGTFVGTVIAPQRKIVKFGAEFEIEGALLGKRVDVSSGVTLRHRPFLALLPTDLAITMSAAPAPQNGSAPPGSVVAGEDVQYTITVVNQGMSHAPGVVALDPLPADLTFVSLDAITQGSCVDPGMGNHGNVNCFFGTLPPGGSAQAMFTARVDPGSSPGLLSNSATVAANVEETTSPNNSTTATVPVVEP